MMQARMRGEKNWYRPDRDLTQLLPGIVKAACDEVEAKGEILTKGSNIPLTEPEIKEVNDTAALLVKLLVAASRRGVTDAEFAACVSALPPIGLQVLAPAALCLLLKKYHHFWMEIPKDPAVPGEA